MATGVSKTKWNEDELDIPEKLENSVSLSYPGKRSMREILRTKPCELELIFDGENNKKALYYGDNLPILAVFLRNPQIYRKVRLVYIDPPFATGSIFQSRAQQNAYTDLLSGANYLEFLRQRLIILRELLANDGSIYVHLDSNMAFHVKVLMDEIFGPQNFRNWITRKKCNPKNYTRKTYGNISDYILFYTKSDNYVWHRAYDDWTEEQIAKEYQYVEEETGRRYKKVPVHAPGKRNGATGQPWRGMSPPPGKHWQYTPDKLDEMDARGEIYWSPNSNPRRKVYLDNSEGKPVQDIWLKFRDAHNQNIHITGYPTEKNPELLARIIQASSNPGDLVLDCFSGSGTTLAIADQLGRNWIGIDNSSAAISTILKRFEQGTQPMGDFVTTKRKEEEPVLAQKTLFSFDNMEAAPKDRPTEADHTSSKIKDFQLFCLSGLSNDLKNRE